MQLERALAKRYGWYRANAAMQRHVHRDRRLVVELDELLRKNADPPLETAANAYSKLIGASPTSILAVRSLVRVALGFATWEILAEHGLTDREIAKLMRRAVAGVARRNHDVVTDVVSASSAANPTG